MRKPLKLSDLSPELKRIHAEARAKPKRPRGESPLVLSLVRQLEAAGIAGFTKELKFHPVRRWRFDLAFPAAMLAIEVDGGVWTGGRHTRGAGFIADCEKCNEAILIGWRVLRFPADHIKNGLAIETIKKALAIPPTTIVH